MSVCDWFSKLFIGGDNYKPHKAQLESAEDISIFCKTEFYEKYKVDCAKPDTVESVLNQFIALGYEKPVVVIKGEKRYGGVEQYTATINGDDCADRRYLAINGTYIDFPIDWDSIEKAEFGIVARLKYYLNSLPVETIEITY